MDLAAATPVVATNLADVAHTCSEAVAGLQGASGSHTLQQISGGSLWTRRSQEGHVLRLFLFLCQERSHTWLARNVYSRVYGWQCLLSADQMHSATHTEILRRTEGPSGLNLHISGFCYLHSTPGHA